MEKGIKEMEGKEEDTRVEGKIGKYVRWILVTVLGTLLIATLVMAIYRKFVE